MKRIFFSKWFVVTLVALLIEQMIVASSTFWLAWLGRSISAGTNVTSPLLCFILSLTLVYVPSIAKATFLSLSKVTALENYVALFSKELNCLPHLSRSKEFQETRRSALETESYLVIDEALGFFVFSLSLLVNVILNIAALSIAFGSRLLLAYMLAGTIAVAFTLLASKKVTKDSEVMQDSRSRTYRSLSAAWDAITLGNIYNQNLWRREFAQNSATFKECSSKANRNLEIFTTLALWIALIPIVSVVIHDITLASQGIGTVAAIVATFPRQIQIIQFIAEIVNSMLSGSAVRARISILIKATHVSNIDTQWQGKIDYSRIECMDQFGKKVNPCDFVPPKQGRLTIRGENGSGKSTLLLDIKRRFPDKSIVIPAQCNLKFRSTEGKSLSTGENMFLITQEIMKLSNVNLLLLDEWDANLDISNSNEISSIIDHISQKCCVIEVRHR